MKSRLLRLREHVSDYHDALEETAPARQLLDGAISRQRYVRLHAQLYHIHRSLDDDYVSSRELQPFWDPEDLRSTILERDLGNLGCETLPSPTEPTQEVLDRISTWHNTWPGLVGTLYVVKGGRFGAKVLIDPISTALGVSPEEGAGMDYYLHGRGKLPDQWRSFTREVNEASLSPEQEQVLFDSARGLFKGLLKVYRAV